METIEQGSKPPALWQLALAFAGLYIIWGSTYLGIKIAVETMPPLLMGACRFIPAGAILIAFARWRGAEAATGRQWKTAWVVGGFLIFGGNGFVALAALSVDSSVIALLIASNPIFMTLIGWGAGVQRRPGLISVSSLALGFLGVALLIYSRGGFDLDGEWRGYALVMAAILFWTTGSVYSKRQAHPRSPWLASGMQMLCGGAVCLAVGLLLGEGGAFDWNAFSLRSLLAFTYLIVVGSLAGFTCYVFLLQHCAPATVSSHAYVNPVVAFVLGWLILDESLEPLGWASSGLILLAVFVLLWRQGRKRKR